MENAFGIAPKLHFNGFAFLKHFGSIFVWKMLKQCILLVFQGFCNVFCILGAFLEQFYCIFPRKMLKYCILLVFQGFLQCFSHFLEHFWSNFIALKILHFARFSKDFCNVFRIFGAFLEQFYCIFPRKMLKYCILLVFQGFFQWF